MTTEYLGPERRASCISEESGVSVDAALATLAANYTHLARDFSEMKDDIKEIKDKPQVSVDDFQETRKSVTALERRVNKAIGGLIAAQVIVGILLALLGAGVIKV
jgi:hypothetical protein